MPHPTRTIAGRRAETAARDYLEQRGLQHRHSNFRCRFGEIDLVMEDGRTIVFVEVRLRRNAAFGGAAASVTPPKQRKLCSTAAIYLEQFRVAHRPVRFDIVAFDGDNAQPEWLRDAFRPES